MWIDGGLSCPARQCSLNAIFLPTRKANLYPQIKKRGEVGENISNEKKGEFWANKEGIYRHLDTVAS